MGSALFEGLQEGNRIEAKLAKNGLPASVWETYSAFANTEGGTIVLGMQEKPDGSLVSVGVPDAALLVKKLWDAVNNSSKVSVNLLTNSDVSIVEEEGKELVVITVPRAGRQQRPVFTGKDRERGTYRRNGEGDYHCSSEEIMAMVRDAAPTPLDAGLLPEFSLEALSENTIQRFRSAVEAVRPHHPWLGLGVEDLLMRLNAAGRENGEGSLHPTRAGLLMFGNEYDIVKEFPEYSLDYRQMGAGTRWADRVVSQDGTWTGNVFDFWTEVLPRLAQGVKHPFALAQNLQRIEDTEMHAAVREAFINSLVHADYYGRRGVVALRYPDRMEFSNPGSSRVALDVMLAGGVSDARNPTMMKMFGLLNACEKAGSGFDVMRGAAAAADAEAPAVEEQFDPDRVKVTLWLGNAASSATDAVFAHERANRERVEYWTVSLKDLSGDQEKVLDLAKRQESFSRQDVESLLDCGATKAKSVVGSLVEKGLLASEGSARSTRYRSTARA